MASSPLAFRRNSDDSVSVVGEWPQKAAFSHTWLESPTTELIVEGDHIKINVSNGQAEYRITERGLLSVNAALVFGTRLEGAVL